MPAKRHAAEPMPGRTASRHGVTTASSWRSWEVWRRRSRRPLRRCAGGRSVRGRRRGAQDESASSFWGSSTSARPNGVRRGPGDLDPVTGSPSWSARHRARTGCLALRRCGRPASAVGLAGRRPYGSSSRESRSWAEASRMSPKATPTSAGPAALPSDREERGIALPRTRTRWREGSTGPSPAPPQHHGSRWFPVRRRAGSGHLEALRAGSNGQCLNTSSMNLAASRRLLCMRGSRLHHPSTNRNFRANQSFFSNQGGESTLGVSRCGGTLAWGLRSPVSDPAREPRFMPPGIISHISHYNQLLRSSGRMRSWCASWSRSPTWRRRRGPWRRRTELETCARCDPLSASAGRLRSARKKGVAAAATPAPVHTRIGVDPARDRRPRTARVRRADRGCGRRAA